MIGRTGGRFPRFRPGGLAEGESPWRRPQVPHTLFKFRTMAYFTNFVDLYNWSHTKTTPDRRPAVGRPDLVLEMLALSWAAALCVGRATDHPCAARAVGRPFPLAFAPAIAHHAPRDESSSPWPHRPAGGGGFARRPFAWR